MFVKVDNVGIGKQKTILHLWKQLYSLGFLRRLTTHRVYICVLSDGRRKSKRRNDSVLLTVHFRQWNNLQAFGIFHNFLTVLHGALRIKSPRPDEKTKKIEAIEQFDPLGYFAMSDFGLSIHSVSSVAAAISAPAELDSACADCDSQTPPASRGDFTHPPPFNNLHQSLLHIGPGGLGTVLEEELTMLAREREEELAINDQDSDLLALFQQKEKDLVLAAKLGKALLERNQDLTKQYEKMTKDLNEKLEVRQF